MASLPAAAQRLLSDFIHDVKHSWRFKVAAVMWIPLFVTVMIAIVDLGKRHTFSLQSPDWRTQYVNEDSGISFPDITIALSSNTAATIPTATCNQRGVLAPSTSCGTNKCYNFKTSQFQAMQSTEGQNHITCQLAVQAQNTDNTEFNITVPQGFIWQPNPPTYVQANTLAEVDFWRERLVTLDGRSADEWFTQVTYQSSDFFQANITGAPFPATIIFRIPVRAMITNQQYISFDRWNLLANWGGVIFFMWFLHGIAFGFAKLFLPNDSKLLPAPDASASTYETIK